MPFIIIFLVIPFLELATFASVSEHIGIWTTLSLAFLTAMLGGMVVKYQGLQTLVAMRGAMDQGALPLNEIFDGFCLVAAGALLITPGFITDTVGFALLIPAFRGVLRHFIRTHTSWSVHSSGGASRPQNSQDGVIEGEFERVDEDDPQIGR